MKVKSLIILLLMFFTFFINFCRASSSTEPPKTDAPKWFRYEDVDVRGDQEPKNNQTGWYLRGGDFEKLLFSSQRTAPYAQYTYSEADLLIQTLDSVSYLEATPLDEASSARLVEIWQNYRVKQLGMQCVYSVYCMPHPTF